MWTGLADFIERSPNFAGKLAMPALVIGGALQFAVDFGIIDRGAFGGVVTQAAPVLWVTGFALLAIWLLMLISRIPKAIGDWTSTKRHGKQVVDNLRFLDLKSRFVLLIILAEQGGRCPNSSNQAFENLKALGILELEMDFAGNFNSHGVWKISRFIKGRKELENSLAAQIKAATNIDVSTAEGRRRYLQIYPQSI